MPYFYYCRGKFKIMDIAAIVRHNSPQMIMRCYAGFIEDFHLKVDTNINLFSDCSSDILKVRELEIGLRGGQRGI